MTRDRRLFSLDRMVQELLLELEDEGLSLSDCMVKCCVQAARTVLSLVDEELDLDALSEAVSTELRRALMLLRPAEVRRVLTAYARMLVQLEVVEIT